MMKKIFVTLSIILIAKFSYSVDLHWQVNPHDYESNMNVTASVYIDAEEQQNEMLEIGVFFGNELRGSALPRFSQLVQKYVYDLTIYSNEACNLSFKLYDHSTNTISELICDQILTFEANGTLGNAINPYIVYFSAVSNENNVLYIPDVVATPSKDAVLPVHIDNTSEIVSVLFTIDLPVGMYLKTDDINIGIRGEDHIVNINQINDHKYVCEMYSPTNKTLRGYTGKLFEIGFNISNSLPDGSTHQMILSDVVLSDITTNNAMTSYEIGNLFVINGVDFVVQEVSSQEQEVIPGETINVSWKVVNDGGLPATGGWKEEISLISDNGASVLLGTLYNEELLSEGAQMFRSTMLNIPQILGLDGNVRIQIKLIANADSGENYSFGSNNTSTGDGIINVGKKLFLELPMQSVEENNTSLIKCKLSRSGDWTYTETFDLSKDDDERIELTNSIEIPSGQSATYFYLRVIDNDIIDNDSVVNINAIGDNYEKVTSQLVLEDNEYPNLNIIASVDEITEGETFQLYISTEEAPEKAITIYLNSDYSEHFDFPAQVILPSGSETVTVDVDVVDDDIANVSIYTIFTVHASRYNASECHIELLDNDLPEIALELTPNTISESAGQTAVFATLKRLTLNDNKVTVILSDNSDGHLYYSTQIINLEPGVSEKPFTIGVIDNSLVDGEQEYVITASIYISSCNCSASGTTAGVVEETLKVLDNDGPALSLSSSKSMLFEGSEEATILTVTRNAVTDESLTVTISSDADDVLNYENTITIPAGETSANLVVSADENNISSDNRTVVFTATAYEYANGTCWAMITDRTLPDVIVSAVTPAENQIMAGEIQDVSITVSNVGTADCSAPVKVSLYLDNKELTTYYIQDNINPDASASMTKSVLFPRKVGTYNLYAVVNDTETIEELMYINNTSEYVPVTLQPSFTASVSTDKLIYNQEETVNIYGEISGSDIANAEVDVYIINKGLRQVIEVVTDSLGQFSTEWQPYSGQIGHFSIGACYPDENLSDELTGIDIYGLKRTSNSHITCDTYVNEPYNGTIELYNPGRLPLTAVNVEVVSAPEHCNVETQIQSVINGDDVAVLSYTITSNSVSSGYDYEKIKLRVTTAEQAYLDIVLCHYCYLRKGLLVAYIEGEDTTSINTTMIKGESRDYSFTVTNIGKGETGKISLALPDVDWMKAVTPVEMSSLAYGESATIVLRLSPTDDMQLNNIVTGHIGINCENGDGIAVDFNIEIVSENTGILTVDVCDEYTYNTIEAPHVAGARVMISHPVTGALITEGITNEDGKFSVELPEGYYILDVTAEKHESFRNNILVDPGKEKNLTVNISFKAVRSSYTVVHDEINDTYELVEEMVYETDVPMPVVLLDVPERFEGDDMEVGETKIVYFSATNKGLITALNTTINIPVDTEVWSFEALGNVGPIDLPPLQTMRVPVAITRKKVDNGSKADNVAEYFDACMAIISMTYEVLCGTELKDNVSAARLAMQMCAIAATNGYLLQSLVNILSNFPNFLSNFPGMQMPTTPDFPVPDVPRPNIIGDDILNDGTNLLVGNIMSWCDSCQSRKAENLINGQVGLYGQAISYAWNTLGEISNLSRSLEGVSDVEERRLTLIWIYRRLQELYELINVGEDGEQEHREEAMRRIIDALIDISIPCDDGTDNSAETTFNEVCDDLIRYLEYFVDFREECFGDDIWYNGENIDERELFFDFLLEFLDATYEEIMEVRPGDITEEQVLRLLERIDNFANNIRSDNVINQNALMEFIEQAEELNNKAIDLGYESLIDQFSGAYENLNERYEELSESVCSSVSLQLSQRMTMTRQAFLGTLTVFNGHDSIAMQNVRLSLDVRDEYGTMVTSREFEIHVESLDVFEGDDVLNADWSLAAGETGVAKIRFIPTKYAAPTTEMKYSFGGRLSYLDPFKGTEVTIDLYPVTLTVKPSPNLQLTYFMQRDIFGDDPLTTEIVEASVPAEFSLLINNIGNGDATNVKMLTKQPDIKENEKGLLIDFELLYSQLNGEEKTMALGGNVATDFDTIHAHSTEYAQWWLQSSLLGHFTEYDVSAIHVNSYGNENLSLLDTVTIHELIRSIKVNSEEELLTAFLVNDVIDADDMPDMLYICDGTTEEVNIITTSTINKNSDTEYILTAYPTSIGWNYGSIVDPTNGKQEIIGIVRQSDGVEINLRNFWQTDRTLRDGNDPLYENRIHFIDKFGLDEEAYLLTFADKPEKILEVEAFIGLPSYNDVIMEPLKEVVVRFNKAIDASTFTYDDLIMTNEGRNQNVSKIIITPLSDMEYKLDISELTVHNGYYVLTVQTAEISDQEGFKGKTGKMAQWVQYVFGNQTLILENGWNWTSFYLDMNDEEDFNMFKNALGDKGEQIKSQFEHTNYENSHDVWIGDLNTLSTDKMYMIKMSEKQDVNIEGYFANPYNHPINIEPNWTWFPFMLNNNMSIENAFADFTPNQGDYVKSQAGFSQYVNGFGWFGDCEILEVGRGYMYKNTTDMTKTLVYPSDFSIERSVNNSAQIEKYWSLNPNEYSTNMCVIAVVNINGEEMSDYEIGAFCKGECRGSARPIFIEHLNAYMIFLTIYGNNNDEITFRYYDIYSEQEYNHNNDNNILYVENGTLGSISDPYILYFSGEYVDENHYYELDVYPNPVNRNVEVFLGNTYKIVEIYNSLGVKVAEYNNVNSIKGIETPGVYIIKTADNNVKHCKLFVK